MGKRSQNKEELVLQEHAKSAAGAPLPSIAPGQGHEHNGTILLFYQYQEPVWTAKQHKQVLKDVIALGQTHNITGRGRVAPEGLNCTLSGSPNDIRAFCQGLRDYDKLFLNTDFKLTDGVPLAKLFKSLSIRKTNELVAYGLSGEKAPLLSKFAGEHLQAEDYHKAMASDNTVIIDVRNAYESAIGNFSPPPGGAVLIDPQMRNSIEFPKWLNDERTQKKLHGKKVLMYCTGGIRCERATALVNQLSSVNPNFKPEAVYELQGGIERYLKTYPEGGFWKGKNYLFDRRMEQVPENKPKSELEQDEETFNSNAKCAVCRRKWTTYRGKFKCASPQGLCGVPVLICDNDDCKQSALLNPKQLVCELCIIGHKAPQLMPDLVGLKRKAEEQTTTDGNNDSSSFKKQPATDDTNINDNMCKDRLFLRRLPLTATKTKLQELLGKVKLVHWLSDKNSGAFYGSCIVQLESEQDAQQAATSASGSTLLFEKKKIKVSYCREDPSWPPANLQDKEYPPIGR